MEIVLWKCHLCGHEFKTLNGGLCKICNEPTCLGCFGSKNNQIHSPTKKAESQICLACAKIEKGLDERGKTLNETLAKFTKTREKIKKFEEDSFNKLHKNKDIPPDEIEP